MGEAIRTLVNAPETKKEDQVSQVQNNFNRPLRSPVEKILSLQRTVGNQAVQRLIKSGALQAKLRIGAPGDVYEREADRVADAVIRMPQPQAVSSGTPSIQRACPKCEQGELKRQPIKEEYEEEKLQAKADSGGISEVNPDLESNIQSLKGGGKPLSENERAFFEPRFGQDFSHVRVHTDAQAAEAARAVNARAFTMGKDIVFGAGQYVPETTPGKQLMAHEFVHVIQQNKIAPQIRRKIVVGGKDYIPTSKYINWLKTNYSNAMAEFIKGMHNNGNPPEFKFDSNEQMGYEVKVRYNAIKGIEEVHKGCCSYPPSGGTGYLNSTYWDKKGWYQFTVKSPLPSGKEPSDAIDSIFQSGAGTLLECNSTMVAIQYRAMLKALGKIEFNRKFAGGTGIIISPYHQPPAGVALHPLWEKNLYKTITISGSSDLLPGDWVYFKNIDDYIVKHPGGFWSGEHTMYLGNGKFRGFGVQELTELELKYKLLNAYNKGFKEIDQKSIGDVPGLSNRAHRPVIKEITK